MCVFARVALAWLLLIFALPVGVQASPPAWTSNITWDNGVARKAQGWFFREAKGNLASTLTDRMNGFESASHYQPDHVWYATHFSRDGDLDPPIFLLFFVEKGCVKAEGAIREDAFEELAGKSV